MENNKPFSGKRWHEIPKAVLVKDESTEEERERFEKIKKQAIEMFFPDSPKPDKLESEDDIKEVK